MLDLVLLIDDDPDDNFFHQRAIERAQLARSIHCCNGGEEALAWLAAPGHARPDLILLDINMPRMTGWEFLEEYEAFAGGDEAGTVVVMLSSSNSPLDQARAADFKVVAGYTPKPLTREGMQELVQTLPLPR